MLHRNDILDALTCPDPSWLFAEADAARKAQHGDGVLVRGLLEFSSYCAANCQYCGLRSGNRWLQRFRMSRDEIVSVATQAARSGLGTIVLQAGEDTKLGPEAIAGMVSDIRARSDVALTLSLGEFHPGAYALWRAAGADRYLLKFETSNLALYQWLRPHRQLQDRLRCLRHLAELGYEVGSGNMVGLPRQTLGDLADDLVLMGELHLDMVGIGPFLPHPQTPLGAAQTQAPVGRNEHTPAQACDLLDLTVRCVALARLLLPKAHIPATTALATLAEKGREHALQAGANVLMRDVTPTAYKRLYEIYPNRNCGEDPADGTPGLPRGVNELGRFIQPG